MDALLSRVVDHVAVEEGFRSQPYQNAGDRPTIGYGTTFYPDGTAVTLDDTPVDEARGREILSTVVEKCLNRVIDLVNRDMTDDQYVALADFEYNTGHLSGSTLLAKINAGDDEGAVTELKRWIHAGGRVLPGLVERRSREAALMTSGGME